VRSPRGEIAAHDTTAGAFRHLEVALERKGIAAIPIDNTIASSFALLDDRNQNRLSGLHIFPEGAAIPLTIAADLWELDSFESEEATMEIASTSLLKLDLQAGQLRIHDLVRSWLKSRDQRSEPEMHARLSASKPLRAV
jgi:hypothetical protein